MRELLAGGQSRRLDDEALFGTLTASGNWPRCSRLTTMNAVTTCVRLSTSSDARPLCERPGRRSPNCPPAWAGVWLGKHIRPCSAATPLACAAPPPISRARGQLDHDGQSAARAASLDLIWVAFLIDASAFGLDQHRWTTS